LRQSIKKGILIRKIRPMSYLKRFLIVFLTIFIALTMLSFDYNSQSDGFDYLGFPFTFYIHFEGKCENCYDKLGFNGFLFVLDVLIVGILSTILIYLYSLAFVGVAGEKERGVINKRGE
jgi:hypothetical protein